MSDAKKGGIAMLVLAAFVLASAVFGYVRLVAIEAQVEVSALRMAEIMRTRRDFVGEIHVIHQDVKWIKEQITRIDAKGGK